MLKEILVSANNICTITATPQTETKYKWFNETIVTKKRFLFGSYKIKVKAGWGLSEATPENVFFDGYYGSMNMPERLSSEEMESRQYKLIQRKWYAKSNLYITFINKQYKNYYFWTDEEMDEVLTTIKSINPNLVNIKQDKKI